MIKTLESFLLEVGNLSFERGDYTVIKNKNQSIEVQKFINSFLKGTKIISDGKNGKPLTIEGSVDTNLNTDGKTELDFRGIQLYDYSDTDGKWYLLTIASKEALEKHLISEAGYLNYYSTQMFIFEDGIEKPFEIMFNGDNDTVIAIDKDHFDTPLDIIGMKDRLWVRWIDPKELLPLSDEDIADYKKSLEK